MLAPAFREANEQHRYEYRFDTATEQWQEVAIARPVSEPPVAENPPQDPTPETGQQRSEMGEERPPS